MDDMDDIDNSEPNDNQQDDIINLYQNSQIQDNYDYGQQQQDDDDEDDNDEVDDDDDDNDEEEEEDQEEEEEQVEQQQIEQQINSDNEDDQEEEEQQQYQQQQQQEQEESVPTIKELLEFIYNELYKNKEALNDFIVTICTLWPINASYPI